MSDLDTSQIIVPVLGMHRSGTSMVTRALHHMGMEVGGPLQPPAPDNPRGFWENRFFQALNMRLLAGMGCDTDGFDRGVTLKKTARLLAEMDLSGIVAPIGDYLSKTFHGTHWGFKDPRTVITWPFWQRVFAALGFRDIRPVVVVRGADACVRSLLSRGSFRGAVPGKSLETQAFGLWAAYYQLLDTTLGENVWILRQEDLLDAEKAPALLAQTARYLGLHEAWAGPGLAAVDRSLVHHPRVEAPDAETAVHRVGARLSARRLRVANAWPAPEQTPTPAPEHGTYSLYIVSPENYPHVHAFDEHALCLHHAFRALGHTVPIVRHAYEISGTPIVFGAGMATDPLPEHAVIYNLEQIREPSPWLKPAYLDLLRGRRVWDYSVQNQEALAAYGITDVALCRVGYHPALSTITLLPEAERDIDVLFYGSINERRKTVLEGLQAAGLRLHHETRCYGVRRDNLIARAKMVVNFHYFPAKVMEIVRLSYLWANGVFVVCETGEDADMEAPFAQGAAFCAYESLVETCVYYVDKPEARAVVAARGRALFAAHDQAAYLKQALAAGDASGGQ